MSSLEVLGLNATQILTSHQPQDPLQVSGFRYYKFFILFSFTTNQTKSNNFIENLNCVSLGLVPFKAFLTIFNV